MNSFKAGVALEKGCRVGDSGIFLGGWGGGVVLL